MSKNISHIGKDGEAYFKHTGTYNEVKRPRTKYYYAVVDRETGKLLLRNSQLPIFWSRTVAHSVARSWNDYIVQPVNIDELHTLILSHTNKKAR